MTSKQLEKLNVKIAKKLGWKGFRKEWMPEPLQREKRMTGVAPGNFRHQYIPNYFGNLAYAMQLVNWAIEHGHTFTLSCGWAETNYEAVFYDGNIHFTGFETLPSVAICLAFVQLK